MHSREDNAASIESVACEPGFGRRSVHSVRNVVRQHDSNNPPSIGDDILVVEEILHNSGISDLGLDGLQRRDNICETTLRIC